ncbi:MAG TPA: hypothetical protein VJU84_11010 [Pyrinomonadaceae bacterium]|nr:hypothetical protein [Pyrinomonadaceae bacterium]
MNNRWRLLTAAILCLTIFNTVTADFNVRGKGRLMFRDGSDKKPLARVRVQLMDQDSDLDEVLKKGRTNANGEFDLSGHGEDDWTVCSGCDHPDVYIKFILNEPHRVDVRNLWGFTHFGMTDVKEDVSGTINFGEVMFDSDEKLYPLLFAYAQLQYTSFTELTGDEKVPRNDGLVGILVPEVLEGGVPWTGVEAIHWPGDFFEARSMFHEFGHRIRHAADGNESHFLGDAMLFRYARPHHARFHSNLGFAFNEGWAEYHSTLLDEDALKIAREWKMDEEAGDEMEGNVTNKLWRLSMLCGGFKDGFKNMWVALKAGTGKSIDGGPAAAQTGIHSYKQFRTMLKEKFPNTGCGAENLNLDLDFSKKPSKVIKNLNNAFSPSKIQLPNAAQKRILDKMDARLSQPIKVKWSAARIAKLPVSVRPGMTRLVNKRTSHARAHTDNVHNAIRQFIATVKPATENSRKDGSYEMSIKNGRAAFLKSIAEPRLLQISEIQKELKREQAVTRDMRFRAYITRLLARYAEHEAEIRRALATPGSEIPEILIPLTLRSNMIKAG